MPNLFINSGRDKSQKLKNIDLKDQEKENKDNSTTS